MDEKEFEQKFDKALNKAKSLDLEFTKKQIMKLDNTDKILSNTDRDLAICSTLIAYTKNLVHECFKEFFVESGK